MNTFDEIYRHSVQIRCTGVTYTLIFTAFYAVARNFPAAMLWSLDLRMSSEKITGAPHMLDRLKEVGLENYKRTLHPDGIPSRDHAIWCAVHVFDEYTLKALKVLREHYSQAVVDLLRES